MIYLWEIPDHYPETLLAEYDRERGPDRFAFKQGRPLDSDPSNRPRFRLRESASQLDGVHDIGNSALVPLVSRVLAEILQQTCPSDVQLVPAEIRCRDGLIDDYSIVVVTHSVRGLDHEKSTYKYVPGTESIMSFQRAVYRQDCLGSHDAARDEEFLSNLLISGRLYQSLQRLKGLGLYAPSEMSW